jgi:hypothetical protein
MNWHPNNKTLNIYTVYKAPRDIQANYVVRRWELEKPTDEFCTAETLEAARAQLPAELYNIGRMPADDPTIVESWL